MAEDGQGDWGMEDWLGLMPEGEDGENSSLDSICEAPAPAHILFALSLERRKGR